MFPNCKKTENKKIVSCDREMRKFYIKMPSYTDNIWMGDIKSALLKIDVRSLIIEPILWRRKFRVDKNQYC